MPLANQLWSQGWTNMSQATFGYTSSISGANLVVTPPGRVYYYPKTLRNITVAMLDVFNDMLIKDYNRARGDELIRTINVPITFGPIKKYHQIRKEDGSLKKYYLQVPRLALTYNGTTYNGDRATGVNESRFFYNTNSDISDIDKFFSDIQPAPYDYNFTLHIRTRALDHYAQIIENILPYFNPSIYLRVKEFSFLNIERDLKVTTEGVTPEFNEDIGEDQVREVNGTMDFTVEGFMYRPVTNSALIKTIRYSNFFDETDAESQKASEYVITEDSSVGTSFI